MDNQTPYGGAAPPRVGVRHLLLRAKQVDSTLNMTLSSNGKLNVETPGSSPLGSGLGFGLLALATLAWHYSTAPGKPTQCHWRRFHSHCRAWLPPETVSGPEKTDPSGLEETCCIAPPMILSLGACRQSSGGDGIEGV